MAEVQLLNHKIPHLEAELVRESSECGKAAKKQELLEKEMIKVSEAVQICSHEHMHTHYTRTHITHAHTAEAIGTIGQH